MRGRGESVPRDFPSVRLFRIRKETKSARKSLDEKKFSKSQKGEKERGTASRTKLRKRERERERERVPHTIPSCPASCVLCVVFVCGVRLPRQCRMMWWDTATSTTTERKTTQKTRRRRRRTAHPHPPLLPPPSLSPPPSPPPPLWRVLSLSLPRGRREGGRSRHLSRCHSPS